MFDTLTQTLTPKYMKKYIILSAILFSSVSFAQESKPQLDAVGELVKATYYFENGKIQQEGFFKNGKLDGVWTSYDNKGNKQAVATYNDGEKTGKWFFWSDTTITEVDYSNSRIASVKKGKHDALVNN
ncbi:MORN repeat variant [Flavobacterium segetis]|uniref:MORN repeat variant n=2 Tax=Flavobacterium segetis TaxID=271157 RepID=A0A1M5FFC3_9FLAO|nr:MORN repeat variant [Flavobacterium segetis]